MEQPRDVLEQPGKLAVPWGMFFKKSVSLRLGRDDDEGYNTLLRNMIVAGTIKPSKIVFHRLPMLDAPRPTADLIAGKTGISKLCSMSVKLLQLSRMSGIIQNMQNLQELSTKTRQLGDSDMRITAIGFGAWAIGGGDWQFAWGSQDDSDSIAAIRHAIDLGINWIDTAAIYGLGHSEEIVAKALEGRSQKPYIFTKCSMVWDGERKVGHNLKRDSIRKEMEASLRRLRVDAVDLYQIHWPNPEADIEEGWETLARLKEEGKARYIGVSNFSAAQMERIAKIAPITSLQPPYSMLNRNAEAEILPYCERHSIGVINYSPMVSGLLTGAMTKERAANLPNDDWRRNNAKFQEPQLSRNLQLVELLREIGKPYGRGPGEVAIAWTLRLPAVTAAIVGARSAKQVDGIAGAATFRLKSEEIARIENFLQENPAPAGKS